MTNQLDKKAQAWSALFSEPMSELVKRYTSSVFFDKRLWQADIAGSLAHAEMLAITQAAKKIGDWRLNECNLYVTKEPCPMCSGATIMSRLNRVVYAWGDPKMGCMGGAVELHSLPKLNHRVSVTSGVLEGPCREILQAYFNMKRGRDSTASA